MKMKKIGLLGGMGPESTVDYYRGVVYGLQAASGRDDWFPDVTIKSVNIYEMLALCSASPLDGLIDFLSSGVERLYGAGAEIAAMAANTPHIVFDQVEAQSSIPMISITEATAKAASVKGLTKVGILGTQFTIDHVLYDKPLRNYSIEPVYPSDDDVRVLNHIIVDELEHGRVTPTSKNTVVGIIHTMIDAQHIDGIVLGCTELPILITKDDVPIEVVNSTKAHVDAIVDAACV